ncbi:hypothetical protein BJX70DRAFT_360317 [Aspergillus crustosus]
MPPLSAYTPFESLLFFQFLTTFDTRPTSFVSISDLLRNNKFVRENGAFDARRLSPEALEELYSTLMRDGGDSTSSTEPNGHQSGTPSPSNPKKRKITNLRPDGLPDTGKSNPGLAPFLTSHLYTKYKELATKEIRHEEKRYREIQKEIERLQKEEREAPPEKVAVPAPVPAAQTKLEPAPEPMDVDTTEKPVEQPQPTIESIAAPIEPATIVEPKQSQAEPSRKDQPQHPPAPEPPIQVSTQPVPPEVQLPAQTVGQESQPQKQNLLPESQPQPPTPLQQQQQPPPPASPPQPTAPPQHIPPPSQLIQPTQPQQPQVATPSRPQPIKSGPQVLPQPQVSNGKLPQPASVPQTTQVQSKPAIVPPNVPPTQPQKSVPAPVAVAPVPAPPGPAIAPVQTAPAANTPVPASTPQKAVLTAKGTWKKVAPTPTVPPRGPSQASFQQWSLNQPQPSQPPKPQRTTQPPSFPISESAGQARPPQPSLPIQQTPKLEKKAQRGPQTVATPSTPQPTRPVFQTPAPVSTSGFATPVGPVHGLPATGGRGSRPRLSIQTPGSLTPWKQNPLLTLPHSPRSPDRPRPEDVSPISEKAPSPFGSRAATPEEPEPPRRKGPGRGRKKATESDQTVTKKKAEKATGLASKKRTRSAASSRSRGRSILSRDEESGAESGKVKREIPSTPAGIDTAEPERTATDPKGILISVPRGRGRPKRKRAPSEAPEPEPPQPEISHLSRVDSSDQSAPFVLCARNFPRTGAPIMNDVTMHKYASIFTKPLTERDAPGYRDLVYRPQDLKSIKSCIHQGSKALAAATDAANTPVADGESPVPNGGTPSKNGVLMLPRTEEVIPPKAIVNSAQLEKELIRMFANAVMFNPVPQRGFGPGFPMIADGGDGKRTYVYEPDEGGIIKDTLDMFEDVEQAVTRWRAAERRADELATKSVLSLRRGSASDPNMDSADDVKS